MITKLTIFEHTNIKKKLQTHYLILIMILIYDTNFPYFMKTIQTIVKNTDTSKTLELETQLHSISMKRIYIHNFPIISI